MSGKKFNFYLGVHIINLENSKEISKTVITKVIIRKIIDSEINTYLNQDEKYNTYLIDYDPLNYYSSIFVEKIDVRYNNFIRGLSLEIIIDLLKEVEYKIEK